MVDESAYSFVRWCRPPPPPPLSKSNPKKTDIIFQLPILLTRNQPRPISRYSKQTTHNGWHLILSRNSQPCSRHASCSLAGKPLVTSFVFGLWIALICGELKHHHTSHEGVGCSLTLTSFICLTTIQNFVWHLFVPNRETPRLIKALFLCPPPAIHPKAILLPAFCKIVTKEK